MAKKLARRKIHRAIALAGGPELDDGKQAGFLELRRLPRSPNRGAQVRGIRVPGLNLGRAITPPLDGNSAGAHPIAPGIEQTAARGGYPYHEGTAGRYPCPGDSARHDNVRHILSAPAAASTALRCRRQTVASQDIADRLIADLISQIGQRPSDPVIAPITVLLGDANDELLDLAPDPRSAWAATGFRAIELAGDKLAVPAQDGVWPRHRCDLGENLAA